MKRTLMISFFAASLFAASTAKPFLTMLAALPLVLAGAAAAWPFLTLPKWARARSEQFDTLAREAAKLAPASADTATSRTLTSSGNDSGPRSLPASPAAE